MDENKKQKLTELLGGLDIRDESTDSKSIKRMLKDILKSVKDIKIKEYDESFNDISGKIDTIPQREYDNEFINVIDQINELAQSIPETDISPILEAISELGSELSSRIKAVEDKPSPVFPKIPNPIDHSNELSKITTILLTILGEVTKKDDTEKIKKLEEKVGKLFTLSSGGGNMPQDWQWDSTADGSLSGTINGTNTVFTLSKKAVNKVVFLFRNGVLENLNSYSVSTDQKTITYSGFPPQSGDIIEAKYPK